MVEKMIKLLFPAHESFMQEGNHMHAPEYADWVFVKIYLGNDYQYNI